ncbi:MAG: hypothetical protein ACRC0X_09250 [Brevinema sp.]
MRIVKYLLLMMFFISCGPSPTEIWLEEYGILLQKGVEAFVIDPYSEEIRQIQYQIAEKEAEVDGLLRNASMQEQMSFLSRYYDMRVNFYYSVQ